ncbi:MAG: hypothetical protein HQ515_14015, partial [Phycisphaeraceae bacterium]|nr:hypothetical protein [Phycisphaeraceae bacterium]
MKTLIAIMLLFGGQLLNTAPPRRQVPRRPVRRRRQISPQIKSSPRSVPENPVVGPRASGSVTGKDGEAGNIGVYRRYSRTPSSRKTSRSKPDR